MLFPLPATEFVEKWETPLMVSMSYSQRFATESAAGYTLFPELGSPGVLHRSGQWMCSDELDASICYWDTLACGRAPQSLMENSEFECHTCGNGGSCIPLTIDTSAEGHHKITKQKDIQISYFGNSSTIDGSNIYTASLSSSNHPYYYSVMDGDPNSSTSDTQFSVSWGHYAGSGSNTSNDTIKGSSEAVYKQYSSILLGSNDIDGGFLISSGSDVISSNIDGDKDEWIYTLDFKRKRFEDQLQSGTWTLVLSGSDGGSEKTIHLTDDSIVNLIPHESDYGRRFNIISGSSGTPHTDYSTIGGRYGFFYPEAGVMVFGEKLSDDFTNNDTPTVGEFNTGSGGSNALSPLTSSNEDAKNALRFVNCMRNVDGNTLTLFGQKESTEVTYICHINGQDFNFTNNFSILSGSAKNMFSDDRGVIGGFPISEAYTGIDGEDYVSGSSTMHGNTHTFITQVSLYDDYGNCVAVARLSKPLMKTWDRETYIKVKLSY
tara:strand:- start:202 stop:1671 length:1470 start_codon:yes stop_codon:yes gene_type:complete